MSVSAPALDSARIIDLSLEVHIKADAGTVWQALTDDIGNWWPGPFFCGAGGASSGPPSFKLEAHPGGRMWEDWGAGDGLLWATVVNVVGGKTLELSGTIGPAWGGPNTWFGGFSLEADGAGTKVRFAESGFGRVSEQGAAEKDKGWRFLLETLRSHLEGGEAPSWETFEG